MQKDQRIGFRASNEEVQRLKEAAGRKRMSLTMFVLTASLHLADKVLDGKTELVGTTPKKVQSELAERPAGFERWTAARRESWLIQNRKKP